jgi:hypothetical protein
MDFPWLAEHHHNMRLTPKIIRDTPLHVRGIVLGSALPIDLSSMTSDQYRRIRHIVTTLGSLISPPSVSVCAQMIKRGRVGGRFMLACVLLSLLSLTHINLGRGIQLQQQQVVVDSRNGMSAHFSRISRQNGWIGTIIHQLPAPPHRQSSYTPRHVRKRFASSKAEMLALSLVSSRYGPIRARLTPSVFGL